MRYGENQKLIKLLGKEAQMQVFGEYIYTLTDVADFFGVKTQTVMTWLRSGEMRAARVGHNWWIRGSAINDYVKVREAHLAEYYSKKRSTNGVQS